MRYKVIACSVFTRELSLLAARADVVLDVTWIRQGLHNYPDRLRREIQAEIDRAERRIDDATGVTRPPEEYAAIILAFGLCSRSVAGLSSRRLPIILPRAHDCIGVLLGSHRRYKEEFDAAPGTYWFSPGWIEQSIFPCGVQRDLLRERFAAEYGDENAEYLVEFERESLAAYTRAAYIRWPELDRNEYRERTREIATDMGWEAVTVEGDSGMLERIVNGRWTDDDAITCPPGYGLEVGSEAEVVRCVPLKRGEGEPEQYDG